MGFAELNPSYGDGPICRGDRRVALFLRPLRYFDVAQDQVFAAKGILFSDSSV